MIRTVKSSIKIPLTIKIRTGWEQSTRNADKVVQIAYNEGVEWVAIHGRTRSQGYSGESDWDYIKQIKSNSPLPIIGNGDLNTPMLVETRLKESQCDGVMIGRGCLKNPFIFFDTLKRLNIQKNETQNINSILKNNDLWSIFTKLHEHLATHCDDTILLIQLKKFAA